MHLEFLNYFLRYHDLTHLPRGPRNPVAWHSSMNTMAPYRSARSQICDSGATSPSIEKTPSVTTRRMREDWEDRVRVNTVTSGMWLYRTAKLKRTHVKPVIL